KKKNKEALREYFHIEGDLPIITFIGRLVGEKGADLLPELISRFLQSGGRATFLLLGTGEPKLEAAFREMKQRYAPYFDARLEYNEKIAHQLYAGSDFLLMPSRVEPCGLNQLYALRYGTIPMVRNIGGLKDSISDIGFENGYGITFDHYSVSSAFSSLARAAQLYADQKTFDLIRKRTIALDFSWEKSAKEYMEIYESML
ncbi:MAG: starch synthase, partial [Nonlabens sp.]